MDVLIDAKRMVEVLSKRMNLAFLIHDADFRDLGELYDAGAEKKSLHVVDFLPCHPSWRLCSQSNLENISREVLVPNGMDDFCDMAKILIKPGDYGDVFCFTLHFSSLYGLLESLK